MRVSGASSWRFAAALALAAGCLPGVGLQAPPDSDRYAGPNEDSVRILGPHSGPWLVHAQEKPRIPPPPRRGSLPPLVPIDAAALDRGRAIYAAECASCHGAGGRGDGPAATSLPVKPADQTSFRVMDGWRDGEIAHKVQAGGFQMPAFANIRGDDLVALVAFVRSLSRSPVHGVELHAVAQDEVESFAPVSDATLANPPPEDWLSFRRTPDAAAYSPLTAITRDNVGHLQLAWSRAMESGGLYSTPLVRQGTMFLANPGDVIQALDATTGDLVWEFRWEPPRRRAAGRDDPPPRDPGPSRARSVRNIAVHGDKLIH